MKKILFILAFMLTGYAHADAPITKYRLGSLTGQIFSSGEAACDSIRGDNPNTVYIQAGWSGAGCYTGVAGGVINRRIFIVQLCSDGSAPNTSLPAAQQCSPPPPVCTAGKTYEVTLRAGYREDDAGLPTNYGGCSVDVEAVVSCYSEGKDSTGKTPTYCKFQLKETGTAAPAGATPPVSDIQAPDAKPEKVPPFNPAQGKGCPAGTVSLGIDSTGGSICGGSGTAPIDPPKTEVKQPTTTTTNPDGSTTKVETSTRSNSDGSTTTTTTTTVTGANGGTTVTQTTSTSDKPAGSGGGAGTNDSSDHKKDDFCIKNPDLNVCKNSQVTGDCEQTACEGDAIQCAILRQQKKEYCENTKTNPISTLGEQVLGGNDPMADPFKTPTTIGVGSFNFGDLLGGHSCPPDAVIPLWDGGKFEISYKPICDFAAIMRPILIACATFAALYFVIGAL